MRHFISDDVLQLSGEFSLDKYITREVKALCADTLTILDLVNFFGRNEDL